MIHMNLLQEDVQPTITRMPVDEFCGGRVGTTDGHLYEIEISKGITVVMDEQQLIDLTEAALDALPDMRGQDNDDKGDEWKTGGQPA